MHGLLRALPQLPFGGISIRPPPLSDDPPALALAGVPSPGPSWSSASSMLTVRVFLPTTTQHCRHRGRGNEPGSARGIGRQSCRVQFWPPPPPPPPHHVPPECGHSLQRFAWANLLADLVLPGHSLQLDVFEPVVQNTSRRATVHGVDHLIAHPPLSQRAPEPPRRSRSYYNSR